MTDNKNTAQFNKDPYSILVSPRVTEKAALASERGVYVFNVFTDANKNEIAKAIEKLYKVVPEKVRIVQMPARKTFVRGRRGKTASGKKAYVYLKKGDSITLV